MEPLTDLPKTTSEVIRKPLLGNENGKSFELRDHRVDDQDIRSNMPILLFFQEKYAELIQANNQALLKNIRDQNSVQEMEVDKRLTIPEFKGIIVSINDADINKKFKTSRLLIEDYFTQNSNDRKNSENDQLVMLMPEGKYFSYNNSQFRQICEFSILIIRACSFIYRT
jgi:hypothetical protein